MLTSILQLNGNKQDKGKDIEFTYLATNCLLLEVLLLLNQKLKIPVTIGSSPIPLGIYLVYIYMKCNVKLFADDTSLFTIARETNEAAEHMNHDLQLITQWANDWRMSFNPDPQKQAVELLFSKKRNEIDHPVILFNNIPVKKVNEHKHLGIILDSKLSFSAHIKAAISKARKGIGLLKYLSKYLPRHTLS